MGRRQGNIDIIKLSNGLKIIYSKKRNAAVFLYTVEERKMDNEKFIDLCKEEVMKYVNEHLDKTDKKEITIDNVFVVWSCKTLQNNKALLSTTLFDGMYYECTYNGDKNELYFDAYKKWENRCIKLGGK